MDVIDRLQAWYLSHCNGEWEHDSGLKIAVLDNPGWIIKQRLDSIQLVLDDPGFGEERTEDDWIFVNVRDGVLVVACGPLNFKEALERFLDLVDAPSLIADSSMSG